MSMYFEQFKALVRKGNFIVLDTETTGLHHGEICQIAVIDATGETLLDTLIRPVNGIPIEASRIHGIQPEHVVTAPTWREIVPQVRTILLGRDVVVYNVAYDRRMMHQSAAAGGMEKIEWKNLARWWCAMEIYAEYYGDWNSYHKSYRWQKLSIAASRCNVKVENAHNALGDCLMTLGVIKAMAGEAL